MVLRRINSQRESSSRFSGQILALLRSLKATACPWATGPCSCSRTKMWTATQSLGGGACVRNLALQVSILGEPHGFDRLPYVRLMMLRLELRFGPCSAAPSGPASPLVVWCLTRLKTACGRQLDRLAAICGHVDLPGKPRTSSAPSIPTSSTDVEHGEIRPGGDLRVESLLPGRNHGSSE